MGDGKMDKFHGLSSGGGKWKMGKDVGKLTAARAARRTAFFWRRRSRASSARLPPDISRRKKKKKGGRGCGGEVGCEEEDARRRSGGNAACWCGVVRRGLLAHLIQSWKKRRRLEEFKAGLEFK